MQYLILRNDLTNTLSQLNAVCPHFTQVYPGKKSVMLDMQYLILRKDLTNTS